jgi:hypothetical protein
MIRKNGAAPFTKTAPFFILDQTVDLNIQTVLFRDGNTDDLLDLFLPFDYRIVFVPPINRFDYGLCLTPSDCFNRLPQNHV